MLPRRTSLKASYAFITVSYRSHPAAKSLDLFPTKYPFSDQ
jgi:hypothetical protein